MKPHFSETQCIFTLSALKICEFGRHFETIKFFRNLCISQFKLYLYSIQTYFIFQISIERKLCNCQSVSKSTFNLKNPKSFGNRQGMSVIHSGFNQDIKSSALCDLSSIFGGKLLKKDNLHITYMLIFILRSNWNSQYL